jgi:hypothetical protein
MKAGLSRGELIGEMKHRGLSILEAIKTTRELFGISLGEAKLLVASHPDWQEAAAAAEPMHEEIIQGFQNADVEDRHKSGIRENQAHRTRNTD